MKRKTKKVLIAILILASVLRAYKFVSLPMYGDELTMVTDIYTILKTGMDQLGSSFPLTFEMGAGRPGGYIYFSTLFVALFGPSALGVRMLSYLSGIGIVALTYFLGKKLISEKVGMIGAFLMAINPWSVSLSRGGFEAHFALLLFMIGMTALVYSKNNERYKYVSAVGFALTLITYPTYKLTLPIMLLVLVWYFGGLRKFKSLMKDKVVLRVLVVGFLIAAVAYGQTLYTTSEDRFLNLNVFSREDVSEYLLQRINYERSVVSAAPEFSRFILNRPVEYVNVLISSYVANLSPEFLFVSGDGAPRHNSAESGYFYWVEAVTIVVGVVALSRKKKKELGLLTGWVLVTPLATTLLLEPHGLRNSMMLPALVLLSASGFEQVLGGKNKLLRTAFVGLVALQFVLIFFRLYFVSPQKFSSFWSGAAKQVSDYVVSEKGKYDYVVISNEIDNVEYAYPVYSGVDAEEIIEQNKSGVQIGEYWFKKYDNVHIGYVPEVMLDDFFSKLGGSVLYMDVAESIYYLPDGVTEVGVDGFPSFVVVSR